MATTTQNSYAELPKETIVQEIELKSGIKTIDLVDSSSFSLKIFCKNSVNATLLINHKYTNEQKSVQEIILEKESSLNLINIYENISAAKIHQRLILKENSNLNIIDVVIDSSLLIDQKTTLSEEKASANSTQLILGKNTNNINISTDMLHKHNNTKANMLARAVAQDQSKLSYQGTISIPKDIKNTDSHQNFKALTIGDKAKCNAVPILDVSNDGVSCSHGAAMSRISSDDLFYIQARGLDKNEASKIITKGFLIDSIKHLDEEIQEQIIKLIK